MVLGRLRVPPRPALVVPDELSWTMWGHDPARRGLRPASPEEARVVLVPSRVPEPLASALAIQWRRAPDDATVEKIETRLIGGVDIDGLKPGPAGTGGPQNGGHRTGTHDRDGGEEGSTHAQHGAGHGGQENGDREHIGHEAHGGHDGGGKPDHGGHDEHDAGHDHEHDAGGGHDHADMMAITGEPSEDGLVMEPIELELGPLSRVLPGGLVARVRLDGDVVANCAVDATLHATQGEAAPAASPDPLTPAAWSMAATMAAAANARPAAAPFDKWALLADVELERALSHLAWLRSLAWLLGWEELRDAAQRSLAPLIGGWRSGLEAERSAVTALPTEQRADRLTSARRALGRVKRIISGRRFAWRARGRGAIEGGDRLPGPAGRAAGGSTDARLGDPRYSELDFVIVARTEGDVLARTAVRVAEVDESLRLVGEALERVVSAGGYAEDSASEHASASDGWVEGPRGALRATRGSAGELSFEAPGRELLLRYAGSAAVGEEWAGALLCLASFDLSPWRIAE